MKIKILINKLVDNINENQMICRELEKEGYKILTIRSDRYLNQKEIHLFNGIEEIAAETGEEITTEIHPDRVYPIYKKLIIDGVEIFQLGAKNEDNK